jgi:hypothetical protein
MSDLETRIEAVLERIRERLAADEGASSLSEDQQDLAGRLVKTLAYLPRLKNAQVNVGQVEIAVDALLRSEPQLKLAKLIVEDLEHRIAIYKSVVWSVLEGRSPVAQMLLGVVSHVLVLAVVVTILLFLLADKSWLWVAIGGAVGGITSLLVRLYDFAVVARWSPEADPKVLFFTGLLKPAIGLVFTLFVWTVFRSGIVELKLVQSTDLASGIFALAFAAGFSERFAPDLANRVASTIGARNDA